ncbi:MAG TPA: hypothetical protein VLU95_01745 [Candidatus Acidoferrum sp.]|nr:hypothetical protein [Candidatus Acidoferrum sp.]
MQIGRFLDRGGNLCQTRRETSSSRQSKIPVRGAWQDVGSRRDKIRLLRRAYSLSVSG